MLVNVVSFTETSVHLNIILSDYTYSIHFIYCTTLCWQYFSMCFPPKSKNQLIVSRVFMLTFQNIFCLLDSNVKCQTLCIHCVLYVFFQLLSVWYHHYHQIEKLTHCDMRLTHWGLVTPYDDIDMGQHWLQQWLAAWRHQAINRTNIELLHLMVTVFLSVISRQNLKVNSLCHGSSCLLFRIYSVYFTVFNLTGLLTVTSIIRAQMWQLTDWTQQTVCNSTWKEICFVKIETCKFWDDINFYATWTPKSQCRHHKQPNPWKFICETRLEGEETEKGSWKRQPPTHLPLHQLNNSRHSNHCITHFAYSLRILVHWIFNFTYHFDSYILCIAQTIPTFIEFAMIINIHTPYFKMKWFQLLTIFRKIMKG